MSRPRRNAPISRRRWRARSTTPWNAALELRRAAGRAARCCRARSGRGPTRAPARSLAVGGELAERAAREHLGDRLLAAFGCSAAATSRGTGTGSPRPAGCRPGSSRSPGARISPSGPRRSSVGRREPLRPFFSGLPAFTGAPGFVAGPAFAATRPSRPRRFPASAGLRHGRLAAPALAGPRLGGRDGRRRGELADAPSSAARASPSFPRRPPGRAWASEPRAPWPRACRPLPACPSRRPSLARRACGPAARAPSSSAVASRASSWPWPASLSSGQERRGVLGHALRQRDPASRLCESLDHRDRAGALFFPQRSPPGRGATPRAPGGAGLPPAAFDRQSSCRGGPCRNRRSCRRYTEPVWP